MPSAARASRGDTLWIGAARRGALFEERRPEVPVVEELELRRLVLQVRDLVADGQPFGARDRRVTGLHAELRAEQAGLVDMPLDGDLVGRVGVDVHGHVRGGDIRDPAVQPEGRAAFRERCPVVLQPAAGHQLVEAVEPAQAAGRRQVDEPGMDRPVGDRRLPAQDVPQVEPLPQAHAPGRHDREPQRAVIHDDEVDPVAPAAPQPSLAHRPGGRHGQPQLRSVDRQALDPQLVRYVCQCECRHDSPRFLERVARPPSGIGRRTRIARRTAGEAVAAPTPHGQPGRDLPTVGKSAPRSAAMGPIVGPRCARIQPVPAPVGANRRFLPLRSLTSARLLR